MSKRSRPATTLLSIAFVGGVIACTWGLGLVVQANSSTNRRENPFADIAVEWGIMISVAGAVFMIIAGLGLAAGRRRRARRGHRAHDRPADVSMPEWRRPQ